MLNASSTKSKLIINGVGLVLVAGLYVGLWYWADYMSGTLVEKQTETSDSEDTPTDIGEVKRALAATEDIQTQTRGYILSNDDIVVFIERLESLAREAGLEQTTDAVSDVAYPGMSAALWGGLQVVMSTKGSWADTYQFLSILENIPYKSHLVQSVIEHDTSPGDKEEVPGWRGEFTIKVLKRK